MKNSHGADWDSVAGAIAAAGAGGTVDGAAHAHGLLATSAADAGYLLFVAVAVVCAVIARDGDGNHCFQWRAAIAAEFLVGGVIGTALAANHGYPPFSSSLCKSLLCT